jgi:two-component system cell cycle response regulator CtrA
VFVCKLRKKLANASEGDNQIETVWGGGYMLRDTPETREVQAGPQALAA